MTKTYTKNTWTDEVLGGAERYDIKENGGAAFKSNMQIDLVTPVAVAGTPVNASRMNNLENGVDTLDDALNVYTTGGTSTAYTLTTPRASALTTGEMWRVKFHATAGTTPTLNRDSKGAKSLKYYSAGSKVAITSAVVYAGMVCDVYYDGTDYVLSNGVLRLDELAAPTDVTTLNASTTAHGLAPKATAPASGLINVLGIANGETAYSNKALFDSTAPAALGTASAGSATVAARRDHVHDKQTILLPWGVYSGVGPFSSDAMPYATTIDRTMTLVKLTYAFYVGTNNASNYWTLNLINSSATVIKALNTSALAGNGFYQLSHTFAATTVDTSDSMLRVQVVKTGSPGSIYPAGPILEVRI